MAIPKDLSDARYVIIDLKQHTIYARREDDSYITFPLSASGGHKIKWAKSSGGGHIILALIRLLSNLRLDGGNYVP